MPVFMIHYTRGAAWIPDTPVLEQPLREHGQYMYSLYQQGILMHGGPFLDDSGGMAIINVEDEAAARKIIAEDPAVINQIMSPELHQWYMVDWEKFGQRTAS